MRINAAVAQGWRALQPPFPHAGSNLLRNSIYVSGKVGATTLLSSDPSSVTPLISFGPRMQGGILSSNGNFGKHSNKRTARRKSLHSQWLRSGYDRCIPIAPTIGHTGRIGHYIRAHQSLALST